MCVLLFIFSTRWVCGRCTLAFSVTLMFRFTRSFWCSFLVWWWSLLLGPTLFAIQKVLITGRWSELMQLYLWFELVSDCRFFCDVMMWSNWRFLFHKWEKKVSYFFFWNKVDVVPRLFSWSRYIICFPFSFGKGFEAYGPRCLWLLFDLVSETVWQRMFVFVSLPVMIMWSQGALDTNLLYALMNESSSLSGF